MMTCVDSMYTCAHSVFTCVDCVFTCVEIMFACHNSVFTCDDVLYGSILPFVNMAAIFSLSASELSDQLLLLSLPPVGGRLERRRDRVQSVCAIILIILSWALSHILVCRDRMLSFYGGRSLFLQWRTHARASKPCEKPQCWFSIMKYYMNP